MEKEALAAWRRRADQARGEALRVVTVGADDAAVLRQKAKPVRHINRRVRELLQRMQVTMYRHDGVGLAAPQVGVGQRLIVVDAGDRHCALINPEVVHAEGAQTEPMEGCLSIPDLVGVVERAARVRVRGLDPGGREVWVDADGYFARVLQHEIDHLDGVLFTDRASRVVRTAPETKLKVVFMGSSGFGVTVLEALLAADVVPAAVVTRPDHPAGRGLVRRATPVKQAALAAGLSVHTPESAKDKGLEAVLAALQPDVLVTAAYGQIVPDRLLALPRLGPVNVHPSLLPRHRGPDPIRRALWHGDARTGVTVLRMGREIDAGAVLAQVVMDMQEGEDAEALAGRLAALGGELLVRVLHDLATGEAREVPQDEAAATYAPKVTPEEEVLDWGLSAVDLVRRIRALAPRPGLRTPGGLKLLRAVAERGMEGEGEGEGADPGGVGAGGQVRAAGAGVGVGEEVAAGPGAGRVEDGSTAAIAPGVVVESGTSLVVQAGVGRLRVLEVQPPSGRRMSATDYLRGHPLPVGSTLE